MFILLVADGQFSCYLLTHCVSVTTDSVLGSVVINNIYGNGQMSARNHEAYIPGDHLKIIL